MDRSEQFKLEISFGDSSVLEKTYSIVHPITFLADMFEIAKGMRGTNSVRLWYEKLPGPDGSVLMDSWIKIDETSSEILPALQDTSDTIGMSMHFEDTDPVAVCLVMGCPQHFRGDSRNDAMMAWSKHVDKDHKNDWGDD